MLAVLEQNVGPAETGFSELPAPSCLDGYVTAVTAMHVHPDGRPAMKAPIREPAAQQCLNHKVVVKWRKARFMMFR